jgi:hypothetical protein
VVVKDITEVVAVLVVSVSEVLSWCYLVEDITEVLALLVEAVKEVIPVVVENIKKW